MRVLFFAPEIPFPTRTGGRVRSYGMIRCLSQFASVHVLAIGDPAQLARPEVRRGFASLGVSIEAFLPTGPGRRLGLVEERPHALWHYWSPDLAQAVRAQVAQAPPDIAFFEEMVMAQYADLLSCPAVLDRQKVEWVYHEKVRTPVGAARRLSPAAWLAAVRSRLEAPRFRRFEHAQRGRFGAVFALGEGDRRLLASVHGESVVHIAVIGVEPTIRRAPGRTSAVRFVLLFGSLDYPPNAEAHDFYFRRVWPALRSASSLDTLVVGHGVPLRPLPSRDPRVELRGFVEDAMSVLGGPGVLLVPLRVGGGIRVKILEALAAGMPVVSTSAGAENLDLVDGRHFLRADSPREMVQAVLRLVREPALVESLGQEGARFIEDNFRWDRIARVVEAICRQVAEARSWPAAGREDPQPA
jgi:glycosyltransferase involved in cell wall biosynthesis